MANNFGNERHYDSAGDIYAVLRALHTDRSSVTVQFDGSAAATTSMILEVDLKSRRFRLDQFSTSSYDKYAEAGKKFTLRASVNGIRVIAKDLVVDKIGRDDGGLYYDVKFPATLLYMQRREAFRAWVPGALAVNATLNCQGRATINGRIQNMSATGCRLLAEGRVSPEPQMMEKFHINTYLPLIESTLSCDATTAYSQYLQDRNQTVIGLKFENLKRPDQVTINRFVVQLQREAIT
jgi:flagellar brake protein